MELTLIIKFFLKFLGIYFDEKKKAEIKQEKFDLSEKQLITITSMAIHKIRSTAQIESAKADKAEDWIEVQLSGRMSDHNAQASIEAEQSLNKAIRGPQIVHEQQSKSDAIPGIAKGSNNQN